MNIYLIDDDESRHTYVPRLLEILASAETNLHWTDGFGSSGPEAFQNPLLLSRALKDPEGILLLDVCLEGDEAPLKTLEALREEMRNHVDQTLIQAELNSDEIIDLRDGNDTQVATYIAAAALVLKRPTLIISTLGNVKDTTRRWRRLRSESWVQPSERNPEKRLTYLAEEILGLVTPFARVAEGWNYLVSLAEHRNYFGHSGRRHLASSWDDPAVGTDREKEEMNSAVRLYLENNGIGARVDSKIGARTLKGICHSPKFLAVPLLEEILEIGSFNTKNIYPEKAFPCLVCNDSPGHVILGCYRILKNEHDGLESCVAELAAERPRDPITIKFASTFESEKLAIGAAETLSQAMHIRRQERNYAQPLGTVFEARHRIANAASAGSDLQVDGMTLRMHFQFNVKTVS